MRVGERVVRDVGQGRAAPEVQRLIDRAQSPGRILVAQGLPGLVEQPLEPGIVHLLPVGAQQVAALAPDEQLAVGPLPAARLRSVRIL